MPTRNRVEFIGRLGKAPELTYTGNGKSLTKFSLAVDQGKESPPMWLNITCWEKLAEDMVELLYKGALVFVEGKLQLRTYQAKNGGGEKLAVDIVALDIQLLSPRKVLEADDFAEE